MSNCLPLPAAAEIAEEFKDGVSRDVDAWRSAPAHEVERLFLSLHQQLLDRDGEIDLLRSLVGAMKRNAEATAANIETERIAFRGYIARLEHDLATTLENVVREREAAQTAIARLERDIEER